MSETKVVRDTEMSIEDLMSSALDSSKDSTSEEVVVKTPLQEMKESRSLGLEITEEDMAAVDGGQKRIGILREESLEGVNNTLEELDSLIEKANSVKILEMPKTPQEKVALMTALSDLDLDELHRQQEAVKSDKILEDNGGTAIDLEVDSETAVSAISGSDGTVGDGLFVVKENADIPRRNIKPVDTAASSDNTMSPESREKAIQVIIDKTGLGTTTINFTDEEKAKLRLASQINLVEISDESLKTIDVETPDDGFLNTVKNDLYKVLGTSTSVPLVGSRYRATVRGLSFGEVMNLAMSTNITNLDELNMRLSTIYQAITNTSIGMFTSYDEFLKHTAMIDIRMYVYALYVATNPEIMTVGIECKKDDCGHTFVQDFTPRHLMDYNNLSDYFISIMNTVLTVDKAEARNFHTQSSLITKKRIELPESKIKCDLGLVSCYDMIHNRLPFLHEIEKVLTEKYPDDVNQIRAMIPVFAEIVSGIIITDEDGRSHYITDLMAISDILFNVPYTDFDILMEIGNQNGADYNYDFSVRDVTCPKCGTFTKRVILNLDDEIFTQLQTRRNSRINPKSLPKL